MKAKRFLETLLAGLTCFSFWSGTGKAADARWDDGVPRYTEAKVIIHEDGPKLLFSDSPEMVQKCGVMYRDTVKGKFRLFSITSMIRTAASGLPLSCARPEFVQPSCSWEEMGFQILTVTGWKQAKRPRFAIMASKRKLIP